LKCSSILVILGTKSCHGRNTLYIYHCNKMWHSGIYGVTYYVI